MARYNRDVFEFIDEDADEWLETKDLLTVFKDNKWPTIKGKSPEEMVGLLKGINIVAKKLGISTEAGQGYRALANISEHGGQEVPHLHFHLFGGEKVGKMVV